jgi:hypothetical protein
MRNALVLEYTHEMLMVCNLGEGKRINIPDNHAIYERDTQQKELLDRYKTFYELPETANNALKVVVNDEGKRNIYTPSIVAKDGLLVVEWGGKYYPLVEHARFDASNQSIYVMDDQENELPLRVRVRNIKPADAKNKTEQAYAAADKDKRVSILQKLWDSSKLTELVSEAFDDIHKLSDMESGDYDVVGYKMGGFSKYIIQLSTGQWVRSNTAITEKLEEYELMGVEVSLDAPARLTIGVSTKTTAQGHPIIPTKMVAFRNKDIPVFTF